ncbi:MAG: hypothetical protein PHP25_03130 [Candidatus Moranbacteria bacterium]|nr:hypothetical protein [Candidatus Moranbacteria bacterium]
MSCGKSNCPGCGGKLPPETQEKLKSRGLAYHTWRPDGSYCGTKIKH